MKKSRSGFTIVELLVVIVVIAILAAVSLVAYNGVQQRARDTQRMSDIDNINDAIQIYTADKGHAPDFGGSCSAANRPDNSCFANDMNTGGFDWSALAADLTSYLPNLPVDPCGVKCYDSDGIMHEDGYNYRGFFTYRYNAPAGLPDDYNGKPATDKDYFLGAENLESKADDYAFGFGSF
jgi:prepilin-type N-terminal cleavage/methylation domain-containing protein